MKTNQVKTSLKNRFSKCKLLVLDFDGVLTDDKVYVDQDGKETVRCDRSDGLGIVMLRDTKLVEIFILSKEANVVVGARARKLKIGCFQGIDDKVTLLKSEVAKRGKSLEEVCYVGNDITDVGCMQIVGLAIAVKESFPTVIEVADYITKHSGGSGAVREICDIFLNSLPPIQDSKIL